MMQALKHYAQSLKYFLVGKGVEKKRIWVGYRSNEDPGVPGDPYHFRNRMQGVNVVTLLRLSATASMWPTPTSRPSSGATRSV